MKYYRYDGDQEGSKNYTFDSLLWIFCAAKIQWHERSNDESSDDSWIEEDISGKVSVWSPIWVYDTNWEQIDLLAFAIDENARFYDEWSDEWRSAKEVFSQALDEGIPVTEITKEEFYKIEAPMKINFQGMNNPNGNVVNTVPFGYDEGMTWREWVNSDYNTLEAVGFPVEVTNWEGEEGKLWGASGDALAWILHTPEGDRQVHPDDVIEGKTYQMYFYG